MGASLGEAFLAMAGGAAKEYNKQEDEKRASDTRMKENMKNMVNQLVYHKTITDYTEDRKKREETKAIRANYESLNKMHPVFGQQYLLKKLNGWSDEQVSNYFESEEFKPMDPPEVTEDETDYAEQFLLGIYKDREKIPENLRNSLTKTDKTLTPVLKKEATKVAKKDFVPFSSEALELIKGKPKVQQWLNLNNKYVGVTDSGEVVTSQSIYREPKDSRTEVEKNLSILLKAEQAYAADPSTENKAALDYTKNMVLKGQSAASETFSESKDLYTVPGLDKKVRVMVGNRGTLLYNGKDITGTDISLTEEDEKLGNVVEAKDKYYSKEGKLVTLTRSGLDWYIGDKKVDITEFTPATEATRTAKEEKVTKRQANRVARVSSLGSLRYSLQDHKNTLTASSEGIAGGLLDVKRFVTTSVKGLMELSGVSQQVSVADAEKALKDSGIDFNSLINKDSGALRGYSKQSASQLVYMLGGLLREDGDIAKTSVADIQNATKMINDLSSASSGIAATRKLELIIDTKAAAVFQQQYQDREVSPRERLEAAKQLIDLRYKNDPTKLNQLKKSMKFNPKTGDVKFSSTSGELTLDSLISQSGFYGTMRPVSGNYIGNNR